MAFPGPAASRPPAGMASVAPRGHRGSGKACSTAGRSAPSAGRRASGSVALLLAFCRRALPQTGSLRMNLGSLQHLLRSVRTLAENCKVVVLGSASLLASFPELGPASPPENRQPIAPDPASPPKIRVTHDPSANGAPYRSPGQRPGNGTPCRDPSANGAPYRSPGQRPGNAAQKPHSPERAP